MQSSPLHSCRSIADRPPAPPPRDSSRSAQPHDAGRRRTTEQHNHHHPAATSSNADDEIDVDELMLNDDLMMLGIDNGDEDGDREYDDDAVSDIGGVCGVDSDDVDVDVDDELMPVPVAKHFLDYDDDAQPSAGGFDERLSIVVVAPPPPPAHNELMPTTTAADEPDDESGHIAASHYPGELRRVDKKYETDGEISDFELANHSQTMRARRAEKALSAEDHSQLQLRAAATATSPTVLRRKKHFLDENPIAPEDEAHCVSSIPVAAPSSSMLSTFEHREHRSLDRNYERAKELSHNSSTTNDTHSVLSFVTSHLRRNNPLGHLSTPSGPSSSSGMVVAGGRRKETSFALARFLEPDSTGQHPQQQQHHHRSTGTWPADRSGSDQQHLQQVPPANGDGSGGRRPLPLADMGPKVECVYSLLSMLGCNDPVVMSRKFLELSQTPETCAALRQSRCIPLIVQIIHADEADAGTRQAASRALHNVVNCHPDDKAGRREAKVLRHIEHVMEYCETLKQMLCDGEALADDRDRHPLQAMASLMKISFDEEHRHAMCQLGALQAIASIVQYDHALHGSGGDATADGAASTAAVAANRPDERCIALRRYAAMALTNLTFGDGNNKAALCANKDFMRAFVAQLTSSADDLLPATANVLRNLSWRADAAMQQVLTDIGTVRALTGAVMRSHTESTIKALLSALWNLSSHSVPNKAEFCAVDGALAFLVGMLTYEGPSKTLTVIENAGGILRNVSVHISVNEPYRAILRRHNCLGVLLAQLSSESLTIVSNACGTLWNLSARCAEDQRFLLDNRAVPRLSLLIHSKHKMISNGSSAALKNLLNFRPAAVTHGGLDAVTKAMRLRQLPTLTARKQRALAESLDRTLGETCDNVEVTTATGTRPPSDGQPRSGSSVTATATHSLGFSDSSTQRLTKSDSTTNPQIDPHHRHHSRRDGSVPRCDSRGSNNDSMPPTTSHSSPPTPRHTVKTATATTAPTKIASTFKQQQYSIFSADQTTDFSLRYASDSDYATQPMSSLCPSTLDSIDTCRHYADEGTPRASNTTSYPSLEDGLQVAAVYSEPIDIETPMMFSRHSSMASLSSMDVPDQIDGDADNTNTNSATVSRVTSGWLSPSDIPDSPSRMMRNHHQQIDDNAFSSIDSIDSSNDVGPILEQCIQMGMHKPTPSRLAAAPTAPASPKRSQLPLYKATATATTPSSSRCQPAPTNQTIAYNTSDHLDRSLQSLSDFPQQLDRSNEYPAQTVGGIGSMSASCATDATDERHHHEGNASSVTAMDESNEFMLDACDLHESNMTTASSNGGGGGGGISDKHKDPDLMLQSVDRLTQELVSTAEYLRSGAADSSSNHMTTTVLERKSSSTTNTWNEDTCPNEVSFPSISWTAPVLGADDDDADNTLSKSARAPRKSPTPTNDKSTLPVLQPVSTPADSLDTDTATLVNDDDTNDVQQRCADNTEHPDDNNVANDERCALAADGSNNNTTTTTTTAAEQAGIRFQVGGPTFRDHHRLPANSMGYQLDAGRHYTFDACPATTAMTDSTIIALEANKLADDLLLHHHHHHQHAATDDSCNSSLMDLDDIRPPSGMDSCSGYFESQPNSLVGVQPNAGAAIKVAPMFSPQLARRKKSLPVGLMARRALHQFAIGGGGGGGSLESVHSSCILENMKPPSIMDELMDSMMSVASITSEVASPDDASQYDTAVSQMLRHDDDDAEEDERTVAPDETTLLEGNEDDENDDEDDTTTLRSCFDMPFDAAVVSAEPHDQRSMLCRRDDDRYSVDAMTTPTTSDVRKTRSVRRALTLKQKRQATKERYRTYTIAADMMLLDTSADDESSCHGDGDNNQHNDDDDVIDDRTYDAGGGCAVEQREKLDLVKRMFDQTETGGKVIESDIGEGKSRLATPRQRRQEDRVRFQTQIIESFHLDALKQSPITTTDSGSNSIDDDDMSSIRALTERFRFIRDVSPAGNEKPLHPYTHHHHQQLEPIVATEFDSLDNEHEQTDGDANAIDEIDDNDLPSCVDEQTYTVPVVKPSIVARPKIVKPDALVHHIASPIDTDSASTTTTTTNDQPKAIRGKKKAAYVSPYRMNNAPALASATSHSAGPTTLSKPLSPVKQRPASVISRMIATKGTSPNGGVNANDNNSTNGTAKHVAKTHVLLGKTALATKLTRPGFSHAKLSTPPTTPSPQPKPQLERQGTFVKDEPSETLLPAAVPVVDSANTSPVKLRAANKTGAAGGSPTKTPFVSKLRNPLQRSASIGGATTSPAAAHKSSTPSSSGGGGRSSYSNSSSNATTPNHKQPAAVSGGGGPLDQAATAAAAGSRQQRRIGGGVFYRSPSTPTVPQRSNSNASLRATTTTTNGATTPSNGVQQQRGGWQQPPSRSNSNLSRPTSGGSIGNGGTGGVTSRIAGIWKRSDSNKATTAATMTAPKTTPPVRTVKPQTNGNAVAVTARLIRSSTFDNTPPAVAPTTTTTTVISDENSYAEQTNGSKTAPAAIALRRRQPNVAATTSTADADKKRISRLGHHYIQKTPLSRLY